jgi:anti-anti-sigma regulatory factor
MASTTIDILTLSDPTTPETLRAFRASVVALLKAGVRAMLVDIDGVERLDAPVIAALIVGLRESRDRSAVLSLRVSRRPLIETLRVTGLDQVFTLVTPLPVAPPAVPRSAVRPAGPRKRGRFVSVLVAGLAACSAIAGGRAAAESDSTAVDAIHNVIARSDGIRSYQATVAVDLHLRSFPYVSEHLDGTTYFKSPGNFEVVFRKVPAIAHGFDKLYSDIDDPESWERRFDLTLVGDTFRDGHRDLVLRLVQKVRGMIDHEDVEIDPVSWRIDAMEWHYYNGGTIAMTQTFTNVGSFSVISAQHATIRIPYVHASADASYTDYKTNVAIDDTVFTKEKR